MQIKVCGIKDTECIIKMKHLDIHFAGFIFYPPSPRYVMNTDILTNLNKVPENVLKVGVFVNSTMDEIKESGLKYGLDYIQLHGDESVEFCKQIRKDFKVIKAFRVDSSFDFHKTYAFEAASDYYLFDTRSPNYGGSGKKYDWDLLQHYTGNIPFFLSGGIQAEDAERIRHFYHKRMAGIDLNSGFEFKPGYKDIEKLRTFISQLT